jgi:hypothetical protein
MWIWITDDSTFHDKGRWPPDGNLLYSSPIVTASAAFGRSASTPSARRPAGTPLDVYHSNRTRRSRMNPSVQFLEISLSRDRLVFNLEERTGNIWRAKPARD